ncbi:Nucleotide-diphospho-sugar transferase [Venustampulla echinocandica]|uniref:chitin synthase n=1 Tax=Venustampulla echinocandica TaxID=2656787 RepID=A0A370TFH6_9HELO|nr:Nucleotide-diphospho-sugar transferase [Venustampulla echinocandica]RDL33631.1 Nucleotide-diphospho-sugar transferase [Venustampulla echinocandica]
MTQYDTSPWPVKDIVYTSVVGSVMIAAFLEWFLWLAAFIYCLVKVYSKAEHWSVKVLAVVVGTVFSLLRCIFLPIMVVTLPLPSHITQYFPLSLVTVLQWFGFWSFAALLTIPWLLCVYQIVTNSLGRTKRIKQVLDEHSAPKVVIVMPCYKEDPDTLVTAIDSVVDCDYPPSCIHVFLSFDGDQEDELYLKTIEKLGVPLSLDTYPKSIDVTYRTARITVSRFPHGGKRHCQKATFKLIDKVYTEYLKRNDNLFILFIDSDCILDRVCLQNFVYDMELSPGNSRDMLAMTGVITSTTKKHSLITLLQDMEYIHGQLFERTVESGCGAVTCLPGALTMLRFSAFRRMAKYYFADKAEQCEDLFDYGKCHLGEDRWLTHLFMIGAKKRYQIQMCTSAFCKTEAVQTYRSLIKQRRRWFLGFITNEVCMLTDIRIWKRYPVLAVVRFMQNTIRTTALLFFIMIISIISTSKKVQDLPVGFIGISLGLNWVMMIYFGAKLRRFKIWLYPLMFIINPFFNWYYMVYGIFTAGQRTWGGPRADAGAADSSMTPQQVIEKAVAEGDELNVVPETFKPAAEAQKNRMVRTGVPLMPPEQIEGRFTAPERLPGGWYHQDNESIGSTEFGGFGSSSQWRPPAHSRGSFDSGFSLPTNNSSVYMPRRVESIMGDEDKKKYAMAQATQKAAGGAYMSGPPRGKVYEISEADPREDWKDSVESFGSYYDRPELRQRDANYSDADVYSSPEAGPSAQPLTAPQVPQTASNNTNRGSGGSPLARANTSGADSNESAIELEEQPRVASYTQHLRGQSQWR